MSSFNPISPALLFSKNDPQDVRLGDITRTTKEVLVTKSDRITYLMGYPDDEGIKLNGGRTGSAEAPAKIREFFYKMTPPTAREQLKVDLHDLGDLDTKAELAQRHETAKKRVIEIFKNNARLITFGGGHDYGYPDAAGFVQHYKSQGLKPIVINFDAHLDVRPVKNGFNSGTPFFRLLSEFQNDVHFFEIGIQPQCNSVAHRQWAIEHGAHIVDLKESDTKDSLLKILNLPAFENSETPLFISFDIDALTSAEAGGCSQAWVTGLRTQNYLDFFQALKKKVDVRGLGIYEVSPPL
ncbi:MAG: formimidoylglutamase, partial [Pseudobdellovibrio sp.]